MSDPILGKALPRMEENFPKAPVTQTDAGHFLQEEVFFIAVMASFIGVTYFEIVKHAFLPAIISYIALFYISHLEALKLGLKGLEEKDLPKLKETFISGLHFLIPIFILIYLLVYMRLTASYSI